MVQRAMAAGAGSLGTTRQLTAGEPTRDDPAHWERIAGGEEAISTEYAAHRGVYASGDRLLAVNRPAARSRPRSWPTAASPTCSAASTTPASTTRAGSYSSLIQEIWRLFLVAMLVALVVEAGLCLPRPAQALGRALRRCPTLRRSRITRRSLNIMSVTRSLTFLWTPWTVGLSAAVSS